MKLEYKLNPLELIHISTCCNMMKKYIGRILDPISIYPHNEFENKENGGYHVCIELTYFPKDEDKKYNTIPLMINYCMFCGEKIEYERIRA